jgi:hypothetical protein
VSVRVNASVSVNRWFVGKAHLKIVGKWAYLYRAVGGCRGQDCKVAAQLVACDQAGVPGRGDKSHVLVARRRS